MSPRSMDSGGRFTNLTIDTSVRAISSPTPVLDESGACYSADVKMEDASPADQENAVYDPEKPETIFKAGLGLINHVTQQVKKLNLDTQLRKTVWSRDMAHLKAMTAPKTFIAVCGATGSGKSSLVNAVLDRSVVPTSGMRACTAVITEVSYHNKKSIDGDVLFLTRREWKEELEKLLHDLLDEDGKCLPPEQLAADNSEAGVAWAKIHSVYPAWSPTEVVAMTPDAIIDSNADSAEYLGTTHKISARSSEKFGEKIAKFVESWHGTTVAPPSASGDQNDGIKRERQSKTPGLKRSNSPQPEEAAENVITYEIWPLIKLVKIRCNSKALSTGAVLVDLPGVADANAARGQIAKDYMKSANFIWVVAPITRAVNDRIAQSLLGDAFKTQLANGKYDPSSITFIATRTDDISCQETISNLKLKNDPTLQELETRIKNHPGTLERMRLKNKTFDELIEALEHQRETLETQKDRLENHLTALLDGTVSHKPRTRSNAGPSKRKRADDDGPRSKRRKGTNKKKPPPRRRRPLGSDDSSDAGSESESEPSDESEEEEEPEAEEFEDIEEIMDIGIVRGMIAEKKEKLQANRAKIKENRETQKSHSNRITEFEKQEFTLQREKNTLCSLKRSEYAKRELARDFREGFRQMQGEDDNEAERDLELPVFCCSARDYMRLNKKKQARSDGNAVCFTSAAETEIPALQRWCHRLTLSSRERAKTAFLSHFDLFLSSMSEFFSRDYGSTEEDRQSMRNLWESPYRKKNVDPILLEWDAPLTPLSQIFDDEDVKIVKVVGISARLRVEYQRLASDLTRQIIQRFKDDIGKALRLGIDQCKKEMHAKAVQFTELPAATFRAVARRNGEWDDYDWNHDFVALLLKKLAPPYRQFFKRDLFAEAIKTAVDTIENLLREVSSTTPSNMHSECVDQIDEWLLKCRGNFSDIKGQLRDVINEGQKDVSRSIAITVKQCLKDVYAAASDRRRGSGTAKKKRENFVKSITTMQDEIFEKVKTELFKELDAAAICVGKLFKEHLWDLSDKTEVNVSVVWQRSGATPNHEKARKGVATRIASMQEKVRAWQNEDARVKREQTLDMMMTN